jgi:predicted Holliday junction resolvase-like endonuclease
MTSKNYKEAKEIITTLKSGKFHCDCPCGCGKEIKLNDTDLFYLDDFSAKGQEAYQELLSDLKEQRAELRNRENILKTKRQVAAKAVNFGFISERIAPALPQFPFAHKDCRSLFEPIDYVIFEGLNKGDNVTKIIFAEIKTGSARLNGHQKEIKALIEDKKVQFKIEPK